MNDDERRGYRAALLDAADLLDAQAKLFRAGAEQVTIPIPEPTPDDEPKDEPMGAQSELTGLGTTGLVGVFRGDFIGRSASVWTTLVDAATIPIRTNLGTLFTLTCADDDARELSVPTSLTFMPPGVLAIVQIINTSGGALSATTFAAAIKQGTVTLPSTGFNRYYHLILTSDGTTWAMIGDNGADIPN